MHNIKNNRLFHMVFIALMTAVISVISPFSVPIPFSPVPLSLTTLILYLSLYLLGSRYSFYSCLLYLFLGLIGIPVFSGFGSGPGKLLGPTGGYLIGYLFIPLLGSIFFKKDRQRPLSCAIGLALGTAACYLFGTLWLAFQTGVSVSEAFLIGVLPFLPGDACKMILTLFLGPQVYSRLHKANIL